MDIRDNEIKKFVTKEIFKEIRDKIEKLYDFNEFNKIAFHGMGGSGIIGNIMIDFFEFESDIPKEIIVNKTYELPKFLNKKWLNVFISYSGKTEETLMVLKKSIEKGFESVFITTNKEAKRLFKEFNYFPYIIPKTDLPPRYNLATLLSASLLLFFEKDKVSSFFDFEDFEMNLANKIVEKLKKKIPVIYSDYKISSVPLRISQQFNENSKIHCIYGSLSEVNHNQLEVNENENFFYIFLRHKKEHERIKIRFEALKEIFKEKGYEFIEINSNEKNLLKTILFFTNLFDFVTIKLGILKNKEFNKNPQIDYLKEYLKNH